MAADSDLLKFIEAARTQGAYHPSDTSQYQLCANFAREFRPAGRSTFWTHPAGRYCFQLDASRFSEPFYPY